MPPRRRQPAHARAARRSGPVDVSHRLRGPDGRFLREARKECTICIETKPSTQFPRTSVSEQCNHAPGACLSCLRRSIHEDFTNKRWDQIHCPECRAQLQYQEVERWADGQLFERYETLAFRAAMAATPNFVWCPKGCGSGQVHEADGPIVTCVQCSHRFCFQHQVEWHAGLTCADYDDFVADPDGFQSRVERQNAKLERKRRKQHLRRQRQEEADHRLAMSLVAAEKAAEANRVAEEQRRAREEAEARERAKRLAQMEAERRRLEKMQREAQQRRREEESSLLTIQTTTKTCPGCKWPIEKNHGCDHMTCTRCGYEFCYVCSADYRRIRERGNHYHSQECRYHSNNLI